MNFVDPWGANPYAAVWGDALYEAGNLAASDGPYPVGDGVALGYLAVVGVVIGSEYVWNETGLSDFVHDFVVDGGAATTAANQALNQAKGGKQNVGDTGLGGYSDEEVARGARDKSIPSSLRRRFQTEEKSRQMRNKRKRGGRNRSLLLFPIEEKGK